MSLTSEREIANTRVKLARLEARYGALRNDADGHRRVREHSLISLKRLISKISSKRKSPAMRRVMRFGDERAGGARWAVERDGDGDDRGVVWRLRARALQL